MVKAGDIIEVSFDSAKGHEPNKKRPAVVISNNEYTLFTSGLVIIVPITNTIRDHFPLHVTLDYRTHTTGQIQCEFLKSIDIAARDYEVIEHLPSDLLIKVQRIIKSFY